MTEQIVCPPGREFCTNHCQNYTKCKELHDKEMQEAFNEIMDEARADFKEGKMDYCPCETCIYAGKEVCELENEEPFKSRKKEYCVEWDEGEIEVDY